MPLTAFDQASALDRVDVLVLDEDEDPRELIHHRVRALALRGRAAEVGREGTAREGRYGEKERPKASKTTLARLAGWPARTGFGIFLGSHARKYHGPPEILY